jgi:hypothetical protein
MVAGDREHDHGDPRDIALRHRAIRLRSAVRRALLTPATL